MSSTMHATTKKNSISAARPAKNTTPIEPHVATHEEIAVRAHELYEKSGRQSGREVEFWLQAERQLREEFSA